MGIFLADLAEKNGLVQEWEVKGRTDFGWYQGSGSEPQVLVEHERNIDGAVEEEVPKLIKGKADLKVVITYTSEEWVEYYQNEAKRKIRGNTDNSESVLLVGDYQTEDPGQRPFEWAVSIFGKGGREMKLSKGERKRRTFYHLKP